MVTDVKAVTAWEESGSGVYYMDWEEGQGTLGSRNVLSSLNGSYTRVNKWSPCTALCLRLMSVLYMCYPHWKSLFPKFHAQFQRALFKMMYVYFYIYEILKRWTHRGYNIFALINLKTLYSTHLLGFMLLVLGTTHRSRYTLGKNSIQATPPSPSHLWLQT